jgi:LPXTG-site transpeptidase (sortase) family protein
MNYSTDTSGFEMPLFATTREQYVVFFLVFMGVFTLTYGALFAVDFLPEKPADDEMRTQLAGATTSSVTEDVNIMNLESDTTALIPATLVDPYPTRILFESLNREVTVVNPKSDAIAALDTALLSGVVRHPDSADFVNRGTIFLFGHSSYLPNVINKNFQAFNGIQNLAWGDVIRLRSSDTEYVYRVDRVYKVGATSAEVKIETGKPKLTLVTCNSFGSKDDRFVVEATLVEERALSS